RRHMIDAHDRRAGSFVACKETAEPETSPASLHAALPIFVARLARAAGLDVRVVAVVPPERLRGDAAQAWADCRAAGIEAAPFGRSEEHTSELQSRENLVCRLLLEKKKIDRKAQGEASADT